MTLCNNDAPIRYKALDVFNYDCSDVIVSFMSTVDIIMYGNKYKISLFLRVSAHLA